MSFVTRRAFATTATRQWIPPDRCQTCLLFRCCQVERPKVSNITFAADSGLSDGDDEVSVLKRKLAKCYVQLEASQLPAATEWAILLQYRDIRTPYAAAGTAWAGGPTRNSMWGHWPLEPEPPIYRERLQQYLAENRDRKRKEHAGSVAANADEHKNRLLVRRQSGSCKREGEEA